MYRLGTTMRTPLGTGLKNPLSMGDLTETLLNLYAQPVVTATEKETTEAPIAAADTGASTYDWTKMLIEGVSAAGSAVMGGYAEILKAEATQDYLESLIKSQSTAPVALPVAPQVSVTDQAALTALLTAATQTAKVEDTPVKTDEKSMVPWIVGGFVLLGGVAITVYALKKK